MFIGKLVSLRRAVLSISERITINQNPTNICKRTSYKDLASLLQIEMNYFLSTNFMLIQVNGNNNTIKLGNRRNKIKHRWVKIFRFMKVQRSFEIHNSIKKGAMRISPLVSYQWKKLFMCLDTNFELMQSGRKIIKHGKMWARADRSKLPMGEEGSEIYEVVEQR